MNNEFRQFRFLEVFQEDSPEALAILLKRIAIPCRIVSMYESKGKHIAYVNFARPIKRKVVKKSFKETDKKYDEYKET